MLTSLVVGVLAVSFGQGLQLLLGPYSRLQGTYVSQAGIAMLSPDSHRYLRGSSSLSAILESPWTNWSYLALGRLGHAAGDAAAFLALLQLLVTVGITAALYNRLCETVSVTAGCATAAAFAVNPLVAQWFRFVQTEALFFSCIVLIVLVAGQQQSRQSSSSDIALIVIGAFAAFMRPNGSLALLSVLAIVVLRRWDRRRAQYALIALALMAPVLLGLGHLSTGDPAEGSLVSHLYSGVVIEGTPDVELLILMPPANDPTDESFAGAVSYVAENPVATLRLSLVRLVVEVSQVRPHYPFAVNALAGSAMTFFLLCALLGFRDTRVAPLRRPAALVMIPILALVGLTFATPEARYGWGALVALSPFVGVGATRLLSSVRRAILKP